MRLTGPDDIGAAIRDRRRQLGLDQQTLADRIGVSRQWIVGIEGGKPRAEIGLVLRTLRALDLHVEVLPSNEAEQSPTARTAAIREGRTGVDIDAIVERARRR